MSTKSSEDLMRPHVLLAHLKAERDFWRTSSRVWRRTAYFLMGVIVAEFTALIIQVLK